VRPTEQDDLRQRTIESCLTVARGETEEHWLPNYGGYLPELVDRAFNHPNGWTLTSEALKKKKTTTSQLRRTNTFVYHSRKKQDDWSKSGFQSLRQSHNGNRNGNEHFRMSPNGKLCLGYRPRLLPAQPVPQITKVPRIDQYPPSKARPQSYKNSHFTLQQKPTKKKQKQNTLHPKRRHSNFGPRSTSG